jgi:hypothetical protein
LSVAFPNRKSDATFAGNALARRAKEKAMAKGQLRSNKEPKKPKKDKVKAPATAGISPTAAVVKKK